MKCVMRGNNLIAQSLAIVFVSTFAAVAQPGSMGALDGVLVAPVVPVAAPLPEFPPLRPDALNIFAEADPAITDAEVAPPVLEHERLREFPPLRPDALNIFAENEQWSVRGRGGRSRAPRQLPGLFFAREVGHMATAAQPAEVARVVPPAVGDVAQALPLQGGAAVVGVEAENPRPARSLWRRFIDLFDWRRYLPQTRTH